MNRRCVSVEVKASQSRAFRKRGKSNRSREALYCQVSDKERARTMVPIVTARFEKDNVAPLWKERSFISVRPLTYAGTGPYSPYKGGRRRHAARKEPSASLGKRLFDILVAS